MPFPNKMSVTGKKWRRQQSREKQTNIFQIIMISNRPQFIIFLNTQVHNIYIFVHVYKQMNWNIGYFTWEFLFLCTL